jgi:AraC-like DNA-binding protein
MRIITLTPDAALGRLRPHIGADTLVDVATLDQLQSAIRGGGIRWVVLDPMALSTPGFQTAVDSIANAGARVVFYTMLARFDYSRLLQSYDRLVPELIFRETDDDWILVRAVLRSTDGSVPAQLLRSTLSVVQRLPEPVRGRTALLFAWASIPGTLSEFCESIGRTPASIRGIFRRVGLRSPTDVLSCARLSRVFERLSDSAVQLNEVAVTGGFGTQRTLERRLKQAAGLAPRAVARQCTRAEYANRLSHWLLR